mmetsp:Transcript_28427/g.46519  ORF Transcript_28427/g.46519 Transcript_28427/m.46519 type:complete len:102 (+) Transcript_28427:287-592(+)
MMTPSSQCNICRAVRSSSHCFQDGSGMSGLIQQRFALLCASVASWVASGLVAGCFARRGDSSSVEPLCDSGGDEVPDSCLGVDRLEDAREGPLLEEAGQEC